MQHRPELQEAFLDGYEQDLGPDDLAAMLACTGNNAARLIVLAHLRGGAEFVMRMHDFLTTLTTRDG